MSDIRLNLDGLKKLQRNAQQLEGTHQVPLHELFTPEFMRHCSRFGSFQEMLDASPFTVRTAEDFRAIPDADWDAYVRQHTSFSCWQEMKQSASAAWVKSRLFQ